MNINGDVVRQLVDQSKDDLMELRSMYDYKFRNVISDIQPDSTETKEIVKDRKQELNDLIEEVEERKEEAEEFFDDFLGNAQPSLPVITARCDDISELRKALSALNDLSLHEWVFEVENYPEKVEDQLTEIVKSPRKGGITPKDDVN